MLTKKFETLCEEVLLPKIDEMLRGHLKEVHEVLDITNRELARIEQKIDDMALEEACEE